MSLRKIWPGLVLFTLGVAVGIGVGTVGCQASALSDASSAAHFNTLKPASTLEPPQAIVPGQRRFGASNIPPDAQPREFNGSHYWIIPLSGDNG